MTAISEITKSMKSRGLSLNSLLRRIPTGAPAVRPSAPADAGQAPSAMTPADRARQVARFRDAGDAARDKAEWAAAETNYWRSLEIEPKQPRIWVQYGHALKERGYLAKAEEAYRRAAFESDAADMYLMLGHVLKEQARHAAAASAYLGTAKAPQEMVAA